MSDLDTLLYRSRMVGRDPASDVRAILRDAIWLNAQHRVTGLLARSGGYYVQVLEGPPPALTQLYANLRRDGRHSEVELLRRAPIARRRFPGWSAVIPDTRAWA